MLPPPSGRRRTGTPAYLRNITTCDRYVYVISCILYRQA